MKKKKRLLSLLLCGAMAFSLCPQVVSAEGVRNSEQAIGGLCEHHPAHDEACGYTEGTKGTPCSHEHTEGCYSLVTSCVHEHRLDCYPAESVSGNTATPSDADGAELTECTHVCSEESGCITKALDCQHEHDDACGYVPAIEGTPCGYVCAICNSQDSTPTSGQSVQKAEDELATSSDVTVLSVEAVQAMIDALPTAEELADMSQEEQGKVYNTLQTAYDAYEALSDAEKLEVSDADIFEDLFAVFNGMVNALEANGVAYIDENGSSQTCSDATHVTNSDTAWGSTDGQTKWYVVSSDVTINVSSPSQSRFTVTGSVSLILTDGCTLTINGGIGVLGSNSLTIYGQTNGTGKLICQNVADNHAGIGGNAGTTTSGVAGNCGQITIHGGMIEVTGGSNGAGIGCGPFGTGDTINITGGTVTAQGGSSGAGIGCGHNGTGGTINVTGGTVTAQGGSNGAGIGHGSGAEKSFGTITISGGKVTAKGGFGGAGIGGKECNITISGESTQITAQGGSSGAGIGGSSGDAGTITISGGKVDTTGGSGAAGIGGGSNGSGGSITISGGTVTAKGGSGGAGIGGGQYNGTNTTITINGGEVTVTGGGSNAADIGGGGTSSSGTLASNSITIGEGATVKTAEGGTPTIGPYHGPDTDEWSSNENNHWHPCMISGCSESDHQSDKSNHSYAASINKSGALVSACTTCGYVNESTYSGYSLASITVETQPTKLTYNVGESLDLTGLAIKATYSNGTDNVEVSLSYNSTGVTCSPAHGTTLNVDEHNTTSITITFSDKTATTNQLTVAGAFNITGGTNGTDYTYADNVLTVNNGANLTISMTDNTAITSDRIVIAQNATATITLDGVKIKAPQQTSAIDLSSGSKLTLILPTNSTSSLEGGTWDSSDLSGNSSGCAGIHVPVGAELNIQCSETDTHKCLEASCGKLSVKGEVKSAGIGGNGNEGCGTVVIDSGVVTVIGSTAGIGGGDHGSGGNVTINGGIVTATGNSGAGIGGAGSNGPGETVIITGGIVTATGAGGGAGIGGGWESTGGTVTITGGIVQATVAAQGYKGAGIGGGHAATDNGTFSTSTDSATGNAVIFTSSNLAGNEIGDDDDTSDWSGVIFRGTQGFVYGKVTLTDSFTIPSGYTLTIPNGATLTIPEGVTITNNGTIDVVDSGKIEPESRVSGSGAVHQFYTVTFDANGHGTAPAETLVPKSGYITQPTALTADGYTFGGWYKEAECNTPWNFTADPVTGTMTLYAKWTRNSSGGDGTVTFDANGNGTAPEEPLVIKDGLIPQPAAPTADGNAELSFTHASDYTIVIDEESMDPNRESDNADISLSDDANTKVPAAPKTGQDTDEGLNQIWVILIGAVIILIGIGGYVFYTIRKKEDDGR